jgi:hypothetical protein
VYNSYQKLREVQTKYEKKSPIFRRVLSWRKEVLLCKKQNDKTLTITTQLSLSFLYLFTTTMPPKTTVPKTTTPPVKADVAKKTCAVCGKGKAVNFKEETMDKILAHFGTKKAKDQKACRSCNMKTMAAARKAAAAVE